MRLLIILGVVSVFAMPTLAIAQPANDECAGAEVIPFATGTTVVPLDTTTATSSADAVSDVACPGTFIGTCESDVWYSWTAGSDGIAQMGTCNDAAFDTDILVYSGACGALAGSEVACNGDGGGCAGFTSFIPFFPVTAGTNYLIRVGGWDINSFGTGNLTIEFSGLIPVTGLTCTPDQSTGTSEVLMEWTEDDTYDNVSIYLDAVDPGSLIDTVAGVGAGGANSYLYTPAADGAHTLFAVADSGGAFAPSAQCSYFFADPCPATSGADLIPVPTNLPYGGAVSCNAGGLHADNHYYRAFDLCNNYGVTDNIDIRCITTAFNSAPGAATQPVRIRLNIDNNGGAVGPLTGMVMIYEEEFQVGAVANESYNFILGTGFIDPDGTLAGSATTEVGCLDGETLVVEIFTPDGQAAGHSLFMAIPDPAQTNPATDQIGASYILAPACGLTNPIDMVGLGFPTNMWIMDVAWDDAGDCVCGGGVANLTCEQTPGTTQWDLTWEAVGPVGSYEIEIDGDVVAVLDGTATSYQSDAVDAYQTQQCFIAAFDAPGGQGGGGSQINFAGCDFNTAPANSWFEGAEAIAIGDTDFSITNAVLTTGPDLDAAVCAMNIGNNGIFNDLYYCFTAGSTGNVLVSTCGSALNFDTRLAVYSDCLSDDPANVVMCNDDADTGATTPGGTAPPAGNPLCTNFAAELQFEATAGVNYLVRVGTFNQAGLGDGTLTINDCIPPAGASGSSDCTTGDVTLGWTANPNFASMEITRDGVSIANPLVTDSSYVDIAVADGDHVYEIIGDCGSGPNPAVVAVSVLTYSGQTDIVLAMEGLQDNGNFGDVDSGTAMLTALTAAGANVAMVRASIADFPCHSDAGVNNLWIMTGTVPADYRIDQAEGDLIGQANIDGKNVYFEGGDHFGFAHVASLFDTRDGNDDSTYDTGDGDDSYTSMNGLDSGFGLDTSSFSNALYTQDFGTGDDWQDILTPATSDAAGPDAGAIWENNPDGVFGGGVPSPAAETNYVTGIFYNTDSGGKTISTSWEFGGFGGDQTILAQLYHDAFGSTQIVFQRGDANTDGSFNIADEIFMLAALFSGGPQCECPDSCDQNDDGSLNIADAIFGLAALFSGGPTTPPPGPSDCGPDPTDDGLADCLYDAC